MKRFMDFAKPLSIERGEIVAEVDKTEVAGLVLEVLLLRGLMTDQLKLGAARSGVLTIVPSRNKDATRGVVVERGPSIACVTLSTNQLDYFAAFLLRAYRDSAAAVDHLHLELDDSGRAFDLTFVFTTVKLPLSAEDAIELLSKDHSPGRV